MSKKDHPIIQNNALCWSQSALIRALESLMIHNDFLHYCSNLREFCTTYKGNDTTSPIDSSQCTPTSTYIIDLTPPSGTQWMEENLTCEARSKAVKMWLKNDGKVLFGILCTCKMKEQIKNLAERGWLTNGKFLQKKTWYGGLNANVGDFPV